MRRQRLSHVVRADGESQGAPRAVPHIVSKEDNVSFAVGDPLASPCAQPGKQAACPPFLQINSPTVCGLGDVLDVPNLRQTLKPRPSPFVVHNNYGGGFTSDEDRVALQALHFANSKSSGAACLEIQVPNSAQQPQDGRVDTNTAYEVHVGSMDQVCVPLPPWAVRAGARETIYFDPAEVTAAIVTCGGLCPGLNDVVLGLVRKLEDYGVPEGHILGIRYGFRGFYDTKDKPVLLDSKTLEGIHLKGGTILGTSRGGADIRQIVRKIDM